MADKLAQAKQAEYAAERKLSHDLKHQPTPITVFTRVPQKWRFVDLENGNVWLYDRDDDKMKAAHDFAVMSPDSAAAKPQDDPRWPFFQAWLASEGIVPGEGVIWEKDVGLLWRGWSSQHLLVYSPQARKREEYTPTLERNKDGMPVRSAATTHSLAIKMTELVQRLRREGFLELKFPEIRPSCYENWNNDYAIVDTAYPDDIFIGEYFDRDQYDMKFEQYVREFFGADRDPNIEIHFRRGCQEIEVYRTVRTNVNATEPAATTA